MERIQKFQCDAAEKIQERQVALDGKGYGSLRILKAAVVMLFVFCPMSIVAVACPYWTLSSEVQDTSVSAEASLWGLSMSTEIRGESVDKELGMCADEMQGFDDCGKIFAIRGFVITAFFLSLASAGFFLAAFVPFLKFTTVRRRKVTMAGISLASVVLLWSFLGACIAGSVNMQEGYSLNGAGFVFLVLLKFFVLGAIALAVWELKQKITTSSGAEASYQDDKKTQPQAAQDVPPTLLGTGGKPQGMELQKDNAAKNVDAAEMTPKVDAQMLGATVFSGVANFFKKASSEDNQQQAAASTTQEQQSTEVFPQNSPREQAQEPHLHSMFEGASALETTDVEAAAHEATVQLPQLQSPRRDQGYGCACPGM